jgi:hypothetical protein
MRKANIHGSIGGKKKTLRPPRGSIPLASDFSTNHGPGCRSLDAEQSDSSHGAECEENELNIPSLDVTL